MAAGMLTSVVWASVAFGMANLGVTVALTHCNLLQWGGVSHSLFLSALGTLKSAEFCTQPKVRVRSQV